MSSPTSESLKGKVTVLEPSRLERSIIRRSAETRATVPDAELSRDVDVGAALTLCRTQACSLSAVLVRACGKALRAHPRANAAYRDGRFELYSRVNVAVLVASPDGYLHPTVLDADAKSLPELAAELAELAERGERGELTAPELAGATFTLAAAGDSAVDRAAPLITPPQAAALAAGRVRTVPVVRAGEVIPGELLTLNLAADSRILFGTAAAAFLGTIAEQVESAVSG